MNASREKKNRQEVAASGVADPKTARQAQEQAKERRSNRLYAIIAIAFVVVAIGLVVWNSNIIQRGTTAVTGEGESYSAESSTPSMPVSTAFTRIPPCLSSA